MVESQSNELLALSRENAKFILERSDNDNALRAAASPAPLTRERHVAAASPPLLPPRQQQQQQQSPVSVPSVRVSSVRSTNNGPSSPASSSRGRKIVRAEPIPLLRKAMDFDSVSQVGL